MSENYPHQSGDFTVIGPECFTDAEATVICYKGQNYYLEAAAPHSGELHVRGDAPKDLF